MKTWILALVMVTGVTMNAQDGNKKTERPHHGRERMEQKVQLTPEQRTELKSKQLTLALDLNDKQQKEVQKLILARETKKQEMVAQHKADRQAGKKPTQEERFALKSKMLDDQITMQREMKKILTADQYAKFEEIKANRKEKGFRGGHQFRNSRRSKNLRLNVTA